MLGIVFTSLIDMLEEKVSPEFADDVIMEAGLENDGAYTAVGYYPFEQMQRLLGVLVEKTGKSANELLYDFGFYLFGKLGAVHGDVLANTHDMLDMLEHLDGDIHVQVKKLYPDADLPRFKVISRTDNTMRLQYYSERELYPLAEGLMDAAAVHYNCTLERETHQLDTPHTYEFSISLV
ncbi:2,4-dihydroxyhept-2-ene-1,7-dioic acid aldolase [Alteromonas macleodii str. 'Black Sea 11']|uniref:heme NO-binding domain-containing protein n=1 Tax=Alteromonas TaxID=226 RepID=UPI000286E46D|nr:heme NO-binding domain-containing protein [Alteromonas abrolhosensis]AFT76978.1 2,4-dihydroxyhept-2-ene-1,7-dioic acid aldolase [Alteromonas macleodii str. 'Black Sea 11']NKW89280.1 2,4-dihydroxyhept-2-ene-1,7-dioic acid aldolase [Alteromonadaceae bacterium A_SAG4]NKX69547.1 2,4-dihydroxyhept-2-ene-1,7-dioic acid aldolase [Alteromonadaceae bacterium A_SAG7]